MENPGKSIEEPRYSRAINRTHQAPNTKNRRSLSGMSSAANTGHPILKFVTLGGNPAEVANDDSVRKLIRSNASRSTRRGGASLESSTGTSNMVLVPASHRDLASGKSRFALTPRKPLKRVRRQAPRKSGNSLKAEHLNPQILSRHPTGGQNGSPVSVSSLSALLGSPKSLFKSMYSSSYMSAKTRPKVSVMARQFLSQVVQIQHSHPQSMLNSLEGLSKRDQAIFHASLSIASVFYDTALNLVARRLSDRALQIKDETIGAVGLLVIHNILTGSVENWNLHMNGLQQMVEARGGLSQLPSGLRKRLSHPKDPTIKKGGSDALSKIYTFHATTWDCHPRFPFIQPYDDLTSVLVASLSGNDLRLLKLYEKNYMTWGKHDALQVLKIITTVRFSDPLAVFNRLALSEANYLLEYRLLSMSEESPDPEFSAGIQQLFCLVVFLYIDKVLRAMPPLNLGSMVSRLTDTLRRTLIFDSGGLFNHPNLNLLLWTLFIGRVASRNVGERLYLLGKLVRVCGFLDLRRNADFEKCLDEVGPALQPFKTECEEIWKEVENFKSRESYYI
ncbi:hypothetical protein LSUB1_G001775 [Lachnellula subtilissima]|uniref:Uncharacterized protein n=1 Tax=Lachnellula subtilissima TaxID=602034 RepID=A0A8H8S082_9HELO|nr:hypothetical protein LSUB1_G001775 [Lachnellula subtilissima]